MISKKENKNKLCLQLMLEVVDLIFWMLQEALASSGTAATLHAGWSKFPSVLLLLCGTSEKSVKAFKRTLKDLRNHFVLFGWALLSGDFGKLSCYIKIYSAFNCKMIYQPLNF